MQDEKFVITISKYELAHWIQYSSVFGANEVMEILIQYFSYESTLLYELDEKRVFLWGLIHGNVMISLVQQFVCYTKVWEEYFMEEFFISEKLS